MLPPGACDTHVHINDAASLPRYLEQRRRLGVDRTVLVQPTALRFDNTVLLAALAELGRTARAVVTIDRAVPDAELQRLGQLGVTGARFHLLKSPLLGWDDIEPIADRVAPHGWHVQVQCDGRELPDRLHLLSRLSATLVIDQTGKFVEPVAVDHPAFGALLRLVEQGRTYVKLSAPYEVSRSGPPGYADVSALACALVRAAPDRMLWASNWPHGSMPADRRPDDGDLLDLLSRWAPDDAVRARILVDNPAQLYGFG